MIEGGIAYFIGYACMDRRQDSSGTCCILKRAPAAALNYEAKKAYSYLAAYEAGNPKATVAVTCNDLQKLGFALSSYNSCSSDVMIKSGKVVSGSIRITWTGDPGFVTPRISKPEAVITYKGELTEAKP